MLMGTMLGPDRSSLVPISWYRGTHGPRYQQHNHTRRGRLLSTMTAQLPRTRLSRAAREPQP